ncbi:MAG: 5-methyltetrahydropteroyltriglutamate--homocysteine S-methyltransferase, partial [Spirochaetales bacterium]|nr:5-methyltetrahydropteroyltriglutamate--homocysteine S-methyltransferase [Spirochaetales bacterium]
LIEKLSELGDEIYLQIEEPIFVKNPYQKQLDLIEKTYNTLSSVSPNIKIIVTTYFEHSCEAVTELAETSRWGIGLDFVHGKRNITAIDFLKDKHLIAGVVDGRNIWINDIEKTKTLLEQIAEKIDKDKIITSTSCSLLHCPYTLRNEPESNLNKWFSFAVEKIEEVVLIDKIFRNETLSNEDKLKIERNASALKNRKTSDIITNIKISERVKNISNKVRQENASERLESQNKKFALPSLPTTSIGSFPQTPELRKARSEYKKGKISDSEYESEMKNYINSCVTIQEEIGLDVLVHGEPERNDMVEYFGELLNGFHFTKNGWVQSYGSRCVKPPIIYGDISRPQPMTVKWISYAQSRTNKIMKGMLTGPVTIINWSFVRNDIPRSEISTQIALALNDEIADLQDNNIKIIQVDEAAFKEGYPLRKENILEYEEWAVNSFKLTVASAKIETQIHTHMCYSEFNDIIKTIESMDADVITIETARSGNRLLNIFKETGYKNEIGPGVYDIHSPRIPSVEEFKKQIEQRLGVIDKSKFWVNPDCGLKTRKWEEVKPALTNMVKAVKEIRATL